MQASGDLCEDCGFVCEALLDKDVQQIAKDYREDPAFKTTFEVCLAVHRGAVSRTWRSATAIQCKNVGIRSFVTLYAIVKDPAFQKQGRCARFVQGEQSSPMSCDFVFNRQHWVDGTAGFYSAIRAPCHMKFSSKGPR